MKQLLSFLCLQLALVFMSNASAACDCLMVYPVTRHIKTSEFILIVKAIEYEKEEFHHPSSGIRAKVAVQEVLKGNVSIGQELRFDAANPSNCSFRFERDKSYLVFAFRKDDHFEVYSCSFSGEKRFSEKQYRQLKRYIRRKGTAA